MSDFAKRDIKDDSENRVVTGFLHAASWENICLCNLIYNSMRNVR
jgi:hypothetical protein